MEFLPLGDKERAERLEGMVDRMSEKIVNLQLELVEYKELYNNVAEKLNSVNHLISQISSLLVYGKAVEHTLAVDGATVCRVVNHVFVDGVCAECGVSETRPTTKA